MRVYKETDLCSLASISYVKAIVMAEAHKTKAIDKRHKLDKPMQVYMSLAWKAIKR